MQNTEHKSYTKVNKQAAIDSEDSLGGNESFSSKFIL